MRILVVDDEEMLRELISQILRSAGYDVVTASGGAEALAEIEKNAEFFAIITDVRMPGISGWQFFSALRSVGSQLAFKFIFMSGYIPQDDVLRAIQQSGQPFLPKPFTNAQVLEVLKSIIGK